MTPLTPRAIWDAITVDEVVKVKLPNQEEADALANHLRQLKFRCKRQMEALGLPDGLHLKAIKITFDPTTGVANIMLVDKQVKKGKSYEVVMWDEAGVGNAGGEGG